MSIIFQYSFIKVDQLRYKNEIDVESDNDSVHEEDLDYEPVSPGYQYIIWISYMLFGQ